MIQSSRSTVYSKHTYCILTMVFMFCIRQFTVRWWWTSWQFIICQVVTTIIITYGTWRLTILQHLCIISACSGQSECCTKDREWLVWQYQPDNKVLASVVQRVDKVIFIRLITIQWIVYFVSHPDDDRIVFHDAIFYVHDATSKLSVTSSWNNIVFNAVHFLFVLH